MHAGHGYGSDDRGPRGEVGHVRTPHTWPVTLMRLLVSPKGARLTGHARRIDPFQWADQFSAGRVSHHPGNIGAVSRKEGRGLR